MLFDLVDLYAARRRRELHEEGVAAALAFNDPQALNDLSKSPQSQPDGKTVPGQWWRDGNRP